MLITVEEYIERTFSEKSRPHKTTVWRWIREGKIAATKQGKRYYINDKIVNLTDNPLVNRVLCA